MQKGEYVHWPCSEFDPSRASVALDWLQVIVFSSSPACDFDVTCCHAELSATSIGEGAGATQPVRFAVIMAVYKGYCFLWLDGG